jgi:16S rRNA (adenine1518-N6/adenine1519-N6)-dimethyltransferase
VEKFFFTVVKHFQQRRKTMRNSLKTMNLSDSLREDPIFDLRPEQLDVAQFIELTQKKKRMEFKISKKLNPRIRATHCY